MNARKLLALLVASTVLVGGVAAAGAATPADGQASDNMPDDPDANAPEDAGEDADDSDADAAENETESEADEGDEAAADQGPPSEMPEQAPDHVSQIHDRINSFLDGELDNLGHALSDLLGNDGDSAAESADSEGGQSTGSEHADDAAPVA